MAVLVTGFGPFGGEDANPSWEAARLLDSESIAGRTVVARWLPCAFGGAGTALRAAMEEIDPVLWLGLGQAGGRSVVSIERVAINVTDSRGPDEEGEQPVDVPVIAGGPAAYFATVPVKAIWARLTAEGIPAEVSQTAGTFVCNHAFYLASHLAASRSPAPTVGFLHVPLSPAQAARRPGVPSMSVEMVAAALRLAVETALTTDRDLKLAAGASH
jgi:pyroglutamyl-peptidase